MSSEPFIELFCLKSGILTKEVNKELSVFAKRDVRSDLERYTDTLIDRFLLQADPSIRTDAARMGDFYRMFYTLENDIRQFIDLTFKDGHGDGWWEACVPASIKDSVKGIKEREENEGIPPRSSRSLDYTTFGELAEIIQSNWNTFSGVFVNASKNRVIRVLKRLNMARGPIAHSGMIPEEESVRLKLTIRDWYGLLE
jgi:hypothetical protein